MPEFDPIKIFKRLWMLTKWGPYLTVITVISTAVAIISIFISDIIPVVYTIPIAVLFWALYIIVYLFTWSKLTDSLDELITKGNTIYYRLSNDVDKNEEKVSCWDNDIDRVIKGTKLYRRWRHNIGLIKTNEEVSDLGVYQNYVELRVKRLTELRDSL